MTTKTCAFRFTPRPEQEARAARQQAGTLYHQLIALGFTDEQIRAECGDRRSAQLRSIELILAEQEGSDVPMVGVSYGGDYRAEEEYGVSEIHKALESGDGRERVFSGTSADGSWYMGVRADRAMRGYFDAEDVQKRVVTALKRSTDEAAWSGDFRYRSVADLRQELKAAGVSPLPRNKAGLEALHRERIQGLPSALSVGEFHYGDVLIMVPVEPVLTAALRILAESGEHLRCGGSSNPFGRGIAFYDERDFTAETVEGMREAQDYRDRQIKQAESVVALLEENGRLYAIRPGQLSPLGRPHGDYFYINYSPRERGSKQVFGWFTLDELRQNATAGTWPERS